MSSSAMQWSCQHTAPWWYAAAKLTSCSPLHPASLLPGPAPGPACVLPHLHARVGCVVHEVRQQRQHRGVVLLLHNVGSRPSAQAEGTRAAGGSSWKTLVIPTAAPSLPQPQQQTPNCNIQLRLHEPSAVRPQVARLAPAAQSFRPPRPALPRRHLQVWPQVGAHLAQRLARRPPHARVLVHGALRRETGTARVGAGASVQARGCHPAC